MNQSANILLMRKTHKPTVPGAHQELHDAGDAAKMNSLRAGVLGANDGIVSVAALLIGVIATGAGDKAILMADLAATIAGAVSMALGEFVSVSAQRDSEQFFGGQGEAGVAGGSGRGDGGARGDTFRLRHQPVSDGRKVAHF